MQKKLKTFFSSKPELQALKIGGKIFTFFFRNLSANRSLNISEFKENLIAIVVRTHSLTKAQFLSFLVIRYLFSGSSKRFKNEKLLILLLYLIMSQLAEQWQIYINNLVKSRKTRYIKKYYS